MAMAHLEASIQRFENLVAKQELHLQLPSMRGICAYRPEAAPIGRQIYNSERSSYASESKGGRDIALKQGSAPTSPPASHNFTRDVSGGSQQSQFSSRSGTLPEIQRRTNSSKDRTDRNRRMSVTHIMENHSSMSSQGVVQRHLRKRFSSFVEWWEQLEEPPREGWLAQVVNSKSFDSMCAFVIIFNALFTWYTTNWEIANLDKNPTSFMSAMEIVFVVFYTAELVFKLSVHRLYFFCTHEMRWNIFDTILVVFSLCDQLLTAVSSTSGGGTNVTFMRTLRILKMAKILRGLRVLRFFYELRLMLNSLIGSFNSLLWSIVMLSLIFYVFGLIFVQGASLHLFLHGEELEEGQRESILQEFGSVQAAMLALFRTCTGGDDWSHFYHIVLITGTPYAMVFIFFIAFSQIAILNILTAIFVNNAMELARPDADTLAHEHRKKEFEAYEELQELSEMITDGTGMISTEQFATQLKCGRLGARLAVLGISVADADSFLELLTFTMDGGPGPIRPCDFVEGCMRLRGQATGINIQGIQQETRRILRAVDNLRTDQKTKMSQLADAVTYMYDQSGMPQPQLRI